MAATPRLKVKEYFGGATMRQMDVTLEEARDQLAYFFTKDGSENVKVTLEGQPVASYDELVKAAGGECYKGRAFLDVGLYLSNEGRKSIWPKRPA